MVPLAALPKLSLLLLVASTFVVAGCVANEGEPASNETGSTSAFPEDPATGEGGTVRGTVTDDEGVPLAGADAALLPSEITARTGADGTFAFENVPVGEYTLAVAKLGYESRALLVSVVAGETTEQAVQLVALSTKEVYYTTYPFDGYLECTLSTNVWVSACDYPYTAVYYTLSDNGVPTGPLPAEPLNNIWRWNTEIPLGSEGAVSELVWEATTAASTNMMIIVGCPEYDPVLDDCGRWGNIADGTSPVRLEWDNMPAADTIFMTRVYLPWGDPQVALDQSYEVYTSVFYGGKPPKDFSVLPGS